MKHGFKCTACGWEGDDDGNFFVEHKCPMAIGAGNLNITLPICSPGMRYKVKDSEGHITTLTSMANEQELRDEIKILEDRLTLRNEHEKRQELRVYQLENPWISVKERLPEGPLGEVLFVCFGHIYFGEYGYGVFNHYDRQSGTNEMADTTHWMPLPQPPKI